jgi:hypothetical protein
VLTLISFSDPTTDYYRLLKRNSRRFRVDMARRKWCDLWHSHFDWRGFGDKGFIHRRRHLNALLTALQRARIELSNYSGAYQLFAAIHLRDSANDALYVHTPNPNGTEFPVDFSGANEIEELPTLLSGRVDLRIYRVLRQHHADGTESFLVIPRSSGE